MSRQLISRRTALIPAYRPQTFETPNTNAPTRVFLVMMSQIVRPPMFHETNEPSWLEASQPVTMPQTEVLPPSTNTKETACRKLLPDPGEWRVVCWGDFKDLLGPQLSHPERLRDSHRLACYVQVYEITKAQRIEALAQELFGEADHEHQLCPLNLPAAAKLQLMPLLQRRPHIPPQMRREPGVLLPMDRVFKLQLITDPTVDREALPQNESQSEAQSQGFTLKSIPTKSAIPERFLKPWEFQLSREEAFYDVKHADRNGLTQRVKRWLSGRKQFQKWQTLLSGKNPEDQLWSVRPPKGAIADPLVQEWARKTLEKAGYDPAGMLIEWQIYWRRKGLSA